MVTSSRTLDPGRSRGGRPRSGPLAVGVAALVAVALAACEPPPPPDGRDMGVVIEALPATVESGSSVQVAGTLTNHGTTAADGVRFGYGVTNGFTVDSATLGSGSTCVAQSSLSIECTLDAPLAPSASRSVTIDLTAGATFGPTTHVVAVSSAGSEPADDANPNVAAFDLRVVPPVLGQSWPVDMGNGTNYLGTGRLLGAAGVADHPDEGLFLSVNPFCTDKVNGDRYQSGYTGGSCTGEANTEYRAGGYEYVIDVPEDPPGALDVLLWDASYNTTTVGTETPIDSYRQAGREPHTFSLYAADATPLDNLDNPLICSKTFEHDSAFDYGPFLGSERWNRLCTITNPMPGRYILRVRNGGAVTAPKGDGSNQFGVVATYAADGHDPVTSLCDRRSRPDCPTVSGPGEVSIRIATDTSIARIPLGGVGAEHDGRMLRLDLFDPGEGMAGIRLLAPTGPGTWAPSTFTWTSPVAGSGATTTYLDVTSNRFNGRIVTLEVDLAGYEPPSGNQVWLVEYVADPRFVVTDRTTWNAVIIDHS